MTSTSTVSNLRTLYPPIDTYNTGYLKVSSLHEIYFEESGNPKGKPVLFLHGGPGSGTNPNQRRFFDPSHYRIILFDQRGAGKSKPHASLEQNTTSDLVEDIEKLRNYLGIQKWILFGGSWGSTLALAYAETHPERVVAMALRGIFLVTTEELEYMYQAGAVSKIFPEAWEDFIALVPEKERGDMESIMNAYHLMFIGDNIALRQKAAIEWTRYEATVITHIKDPALIESMTGDHFALSFALCENHYFRHRGFFPTNNHSLKTSYLIENINKIKSIPSVIVHGRYDMVCPVDAAYYLHKAWPESKLFIIPDAGHSVNEPGTTDRLIRTMDEFRSFTYSF